MRTKLTFKFITAIIVACLFSIAGSAQNVFVTGALVGNGTYPDLGAAFTAVNGGSQTGANIAITITGNTTEPVTAVLNQGTWSQLVIIPAGGAARTISGTIAGPLIDFNGADRVLVDGLNTGGNSLTIDNTSNTAATSTIRFINDAHVIAVQNCTIRGANTSTTSGTVFFSTGTTTGNDTITLNTCTIDASGANFPCNGIYSSGTAVVGSENSGIVINACNVANYYNATSVTAGILVAAGNTAWTIQNNRLYQSAVRLYTVSGTHSGISVTSGAGYAIAGNTIGYANAGGTGTYCVVGNSIALTGTFPSAYTPAGTANATRFVAINCGFTAGGIVSEIQGNTVAGFALYTSSGATTTNGIFCGIAVTSGNVNVGTTTGNTIGSTTGTGSIYTATTTTGGMVAGIFVTSANAVAIRNNTIGAIDAMGTTATSSGSINGINIAGGMTSYDVSSNIIGNSTNPNLRMGNLTTGANLSNVGTTFSNASGLSTFNGILSSQAGAGTISANTIRNVQQNSTSTSASCSIRGITASGVVTINNNLINNMSSQSGNTGVASTSLAGMGIFLSSISTNGAVVSNNTINSLSLLNTGAIGTNITGVAIYAGTSTLFNNKIYDINNASTSAVAAAPGTASGFFLRQPSGVITIYNNMVSLGNGQTTNTAFNGIWQQNSAVAYTLNAYYNTINIEGTAAAGAQPSFCLNRGSYSATQVTITVNIVNNIFNNTRSGGTGKHYAIGNNYLAAATATGWAANASNYNVLNAAAATVGYWGADMTFAAWQTASASDANSLTAIPTAFVNSATGDLHMNFGVTPTQIESGGTVIATFVTDYDNQNRPGPTGSVNGGGVYPDMGADEFDGVPLDAIAPVITYTPLAFTCSTSDRTFTATITDFSGVPTTGLLQPRVYFQKNVAGWNSSAGVLTSGTGQNGVWTFTISAAAMGGLAIGDVVTYYVIAQDIVTPTPNIRSNPGTGLVATNVNTVTTPPTTPNSFAIANTLSGTYTVGAAGNYATLTAAVAAYNTNCIGGPVVFSLIDPTYSAAETFPIVINQNPSASAVNTLTIVPAAATTCAITGSANTALIKVLGNYVTIDGSNSGGPSRDLTITNTSATTPSVILFGSTGTTPIMNSAIKNCILINGAQTNTAVVVSDGTTLGNAGYFTNITIQNNSVQKAYIGIYAIAALATGNGSGLTISQNDMTTSGANSIRLVAIYMQGVDGGTISGNQIGGMANTLDAANLSGMFIATGTVNCAITGNTINGISGTTTSPVGIRFTTGVAASNSTISGNTVKGLTSAYGGAGAASGIQVAFATGGVTIDGNSVSNIKNTNTGGWGANGIQLTSTLTAANITVKNNFICDIAGYGFAGAGVDDNGYGLILTSGGGYNIFNNTILMNTDQTVVGGLPSAINIGAGLVTAGSVDIRNNILVNTQTVGTERYTIYSAAANTVFSNIDYNNYSTTGPNVGFIGVNRLDVVALQAGFGGNTNSVSILPVFTGAPDLHLPIVSNLTLQDLGVVIASVTTDIDGQTRSVCTPDIGADEFGTPREITVQGNSTTIVDGDVTPSVTDATDFGTQSVCNGTLTSTFTIQNSGSTTLSISGVTITGTNATDFTVTTSPATTVAALGSTTFVVTFDPSAAGVRTATITVNSNDCDEAIFDYAVSGTGTQVAASASAQTNVSCFGGNNGTATVATTGGIAPITYAWSPSGGTGITGTALTMGSYTCTVTDVNGCTATQTFSITEPPVLVASASAGSIACNGGSTTVTVSGSGGTSPYTGTGSFTVTAGTYTYTVTDANGCTNTTTVTVNQPSVVAASTMQTNVSCNGGSNGDAMVMATGGTSPYTYAWAPTGGNAAMATGLTAGLYTCTITDNNGCTNTQTFNITAPGAVTASSSSTSSILCNGGTGSVTVVGGGGIAPYTGEGTFTVTAGTYTYTVTDANGCNATTTITLTEPTAITTAVTTVDVSCNGGSNGSIDLTVSGGTPGYTYDWNSGTYTVEDPSGLIAGTYTGVITDANGCTSTGTVTIAEPAVLVASVTATTNPSVCGATDGVIDITITGGTTAYTFLWNTTAITEDLSGVAAGAYNCTVTDANGCTTTVNGSLSDPNAPTVTLVVPVDTVCSIDGPLVLTGESPAGGTFSGPGVTAGSFDPAVAGVGLHIISYTYTDISGCTGSTTDSIYVDICLGTPAADLSSAVSIYPNPNDGVFTLQLNGSNAADVFVYDAQGKLVSAQKVQPNVATPMDIQSSGMYMVTVVTADGQRTSQRVIVTR